MSETDRETFFDRVTQDVIPKLREEIRTLKAGATDEAILQKDIGVALGTAQEIALDMLSPDCQPAERENIHAGVMGMLIKNINEELGLSHPLIVVVFISKHASKLAILKRDSIPAISNLTEAGVVPFIYVAGIPSGRGVITIEGVPISYTDASLPPDGTMH